MRRHSFFFELPAELESGEPPEVRGLRRDDVRLMVSHHLDDAIVHTGFRNLMIMCGKATCW